MAYLVKKKVKGKDYFYLVNNITVKKKSKKIQIYAGSKKPTRIKLKELKQKLEVKTKKYLASVDPFLKLISENDELILEDVKKHHKKLKKQSPSVIENYYEWFITSLTYNSNAIEGSTLTERETAMVLFEKITPQGRPLKDVRAAENHKKAYDWMISYKGELTKSFILKLHEILSSQILNESESGKIRNVGVYIRGSSQIPPPPEEVNFQLKELTRWYKLNKKKYHPAILASYFHIEFERIHPFVDFNGRTGRLLLDFILLKNKYPPIDIKMNDRQFYYMAIRSAINGNLELFVKLVIKYLKEFLKRD